MATTIATISLSSSDLTSSALAFSSTNPLNTAGSATGLTLTSGLARTTTEYASAGVIESTNLFQSNSATDSGANKVYLKNLSTTPAEFFTVYIDQEEMGRLYAGDWAFFPWSAISGARETFVVTFTLSGGTVAIGDSWEFDGVKTTSVDTTLNNFAAAVDAQHYPNWTTTVSSAAVTFVARRAVEDGVITGNTAVTGDVLVDASSDNLTAPITGGTAGAGSRSESDIVILPSVHTEMTLEHMLFHQ